MVTDAELMRYMEQYLLDELHSDPDTVGKFTKANNTIYVHPYAIWIIPTDVKCYLNIPKASEKSRKIALDLINKAPDFDEFYRIDITKETSGRAIKYKSIDFDVWLNKEIVTAFCGAIENKKIRGWFDYSFYMTNSKSPVYVLDDDKELRGIFMPLNEWAFKNSEKEE
jgi:hypothetical protein